MPEEGRVSVDTLDKHEDFAINGTCKTVQDAVSKFHNGAIPRNIIIKLNGRVVNDTSDPLRNGDSVMIMASGLASGGVKGS